MDAIPLEVIFAHCGDLDWRTISTLRCTAKEFHAFVPDHYPLIANAWRAEFPELIKNLESWSNDMSFEDICRMGHFDFGLLIETITCIKTELYHGEKAYKRALASVFLTDRLWSKSQNTATSTTTAITTDQKLMFENITRFLMALHQECHKRFPGPMQPQNKESVPIYVFACIVKYVTYILNTYGDIYVSLAHPAFVDVFKNRVDYMMVATHGMGIKKHNSLLGRSLAAISKEAHASIRKVMGKLPSLL